ncbi:MAG: hypothetical protein ABFS34_06935 [Gemmatimonadota bacterium]
MTARGVAPSLIGALVLAAACTDRAPTDPDPPAPAPATTFQLQLTGTLDTVFDGVPEVILNVDGDTGVPTWILRLAAAPLSSEALVLTRSGGPPGPGIHQLDIAEEQPTLDASLFFQGEAFAPNSGALDVSERVGDGIVATLTLTLIRGATGNPAPGDVLHVTGSVDAIP